MPLFRYTITPLSAFGTLCAAIRCMGICFVPPVSLMALRR
jgi:hypothetical protein